MKLFKLIILTLFISSCQHANQYYVDQELKEYVKAFESMYNVKATFNIIMTDDLPNEKAGICRYYSPNNPSNIIYINRRYWSYSNKFGREQVLFHEMGHCYAGLRHNSTTGTIGYYNNAPKSIMNDTSFGNRSVYKDNLNYYYKELWQEMMRVR